MASIVAASLRRGIAGLPASVTECSCCAQVSAGVLQSVKDGGTRPDRKLLLLLSNCAHVRTTLVPALSEVCLNCSPHAH